MSASKKPRADAVLKTLPPDRQAAIADYARAHTLTETRQWLAADGLKTSEAAISLWLSWHGLQQRLARNASTVETLLDRLVKTRPDWTPEQLNSAGQIFFTEMAMADQDPEQWRWIQATALQKEKLGLERQKFQRETCELFLKWHEDKQAQEVLRGNTSNTEKIEQLGKLMFGEDWK